MIIKILLLILSIPFSWVIAYVITMVSFWIDLNINRPNSEEMIYIKRKHLDMNKYVWIFVFIVLIVLIFV